MPSKILAIPFGILFLLFGYLTWHDDSYLLYLTPWAIILVIIYAISPQIDWWWYERYPPDVASPIRKMLETVNPFYKQLKEADKKKFRQRLELFVKGVDFMPQGWETIPEDIKYAIAANAVQLNLNKEEFLFPKYEKVVVYPTPFASPQYPETIHPSEVYKEDGVLLFSAQQLTGSFLTPNKYYNIAMHEYVKVYMDSNPTVSLPTFTAKDWSKIGKASPFSVQHIKTLLNVPDSDIDPTVVAITLYQTFPGSFRSVFPSEAKQLDSVFR